MKRPHASSESDDKPNQETVNKSSNVNCLCNEIEAEVVSILPVSRARNDPGEAVKVDKYALQAIIYSFSIRSLCRDCMVIK